MTMQQQQEQNSNKKKRRTNNANKRRMKNKKIERRRTPSFNSDLPEITKNQHQSQRKNTVRTETMMQQKQDKIIAKQEKNH